jgi:Fur family transcriptional regulator, peroxide stress response regulator
MDAEAIKRSFDDSGLRCTPQRYAVMAFLMEHNRHPTAAEIKFREISSRMVAKI